MGSIPTRRAIFEDQTMNTHQKLERLVAQRERARDSLKEAQIARGSGRGSKIRIHAIQNTLTDIKKRIDEVKNEIQVEAILRKESKRVEREEKRTALQKLREDIEYTEAPPESCALCVHFKPEITRGGEHYNPRCGLYHIKVKPNGYCSSYANK